MPDYSMIKEEILKQGVKYDENKERYDLIPPEATEGLVSVLTYGASKYADRNWEMGLKYGRTLGALKRHIAAWEKGHDYDTDDGTKDGPRTKKGSGLLHLSHASANVAFLQTFEARGMGTKFDDIPTRNKGVVSERHARSRAEQFAAQDAGTTGQPANPYEERVDFTKITQATAMSFGQNKEGIDVT